jgi:FKBP-type peptidyl-prolyl cis-trans isomerase
MSKHFVMILGLGLLACNVRAQDQKTNAPLADDKQKLSYAIGMSTGMTLKRLEADVDLDTLANATRDVVSGRATLLTEQEMRDTLSKFNQDIRAKQMEKMKQLSEKNKKEGETYLAQNKDKPGVITLPSGLQYQILKDGSGDSPTADENVTVNYRGTLLDGTEFDSSEKHHQAFTTKVSGGIIKGWTEALELMKPGSKWKIFLPPDLAYGPRGTQGIPPESTLIFEIELVSVSPPTAAAAPESQPLTSDIIKVPSAEELKKGAKIETIKPEDIEKEKAKATNQQ